MAIPPSVRGFSPYFKMLGPRTQVALCQVPLTVVVTALSVIAPFAWPSLLSHPIYVAGTALQIILFLVCFLIPWERLGETAYLIIPAADLVAVGLLRNGAAPLLPSLAILAVFPIIWLAASGMRVRTTMVLSAVGPFLILLPSAAEGLPYLTPADATSLVLFPLMMVVVALAIHFANVNVRLQQLELRTMGEELKEALAASREREELLTTILDAADVAVAAVDRSGRYLLTNNRQRSFRQATGAADELPGQGHQLIFGQDRQTLLPPDKRPINRAIAGESFADYLVWAGAEPVQRAYSTAARPLTAENGRPNGAVVVYSDVTGWVEALAAHEELISNVSHEFRTPLNSILGNVDLVLDDDTELSPSTAQRLSVVQRNSERLLALLSDLSATASAALKVHPKRTDLASLVESSLSSARAEADRSGVRLTADVPSPLWAYADPLRIGQALDNLVSNAIKYSPAGGVVDISAGTSGDFVQLRVRDTGMGMSKDDAERVFRRYFRTDSARQAAIPGAGLGLSITKMIVERHGGKVACTSDQGKGSTFTVTLPADGPPPSF